MYVYYTVPLTFSKARRESVIFFQKYKNWPYGILSFPKARECVLDRKCWPVKVSEYFFSSGIEMKRERKIG
jgi:hypothetical protein